MLLLLLERVFSFLLGIVVTSAGVGLLLLFVWSLQNGETFYGQPLKRFKFSEDRIGFIWAVIWEIFFGTILTFAGIRMLRGMW